MNLLNEKGLGVAGRLKSAGHLRSAIVGAEKQEGTHEIVPLKYEHMAGGRAEAGVGGRGHRRVIVD